MLVLAPGRVSVDHRGWIGTAPGSVVACNRPEIALPGAASAGIEHRHDGFVGKQSRRAEHDFFQAARDRGDLGSGVANPERQRRAVDLNPLARHHLRLAIERLMVGKAADHHVCHRCLSGQTTCDQAWRRGLLHHHTRTAAAGKLWAPRHQHAVLRRDHVEPLGAILADLDQGRFAAGTGGVGRHQHQLDARQMGGQHAAGTPFFGPFAPQCRIASLGFRLDRGNRRFEIIQGERKLLRGQPLRLPPELHPAQLQQQGVQPLVACRQLVALGHRCIALGNGRIALRDHRQHQGPQRLGLGR